MTKWRNVSVTLAGIILLMPLVYFAAHVVHGQVGNKSTPSASTGIPAPMLYDNGDPISLGYTCDSTRMGIPFYNMNSGIARPIWICNGTAWAQDAPTIQGATASFGGAALLLGGSVSSTASVPNAPQGSNCIATRADGTLLAVGLVIDCNVATSGTATVRISASLAGTPAAGTYNVRVIP